MDNETLNNLFDLLKLISILLTIIIVIFILRKPLGEFVKKIKSVEHENKDNKFKIETENNTTEHKEIQYVDKDKSLEKNKISVIDEIKSDKDKSVEFSSVMQLFKDGSVDSIKESFQVYSENEKDSKQLIKNKYVYLYFLFHDKKHIESVDELEKLMMIQEDEKIKLYGADWLSFAYKDLDRNEDEQKLWENLSKLFTEPLLKTTAIVNWSRSSNDKDTNTMKKILVNRLNEINTNDEKALLFRELSNIERKLGNDEISVYCRDKSLEYDNLNTSELFDTAYSQKDKKYEFLSISNYKRLLEIEPKNAMALNNMGVNASDNKLNFIAIANYKKAEEEKNTLAIANRANKLIESGFIDEAKEIANAALSLDNVHPNIYDILSRVESIKEKENDKWIEIQFKAEHYQKNIRNYVKSYYVTENNNITGTWIINQNEQFITTTSSSNDLNVSWTKVINNIDYECSLKGKFENLSFSGIYKVYSAEEKPSLALLSFSQNKTIEVLGYLSDDRKEFYIFAKNEKENFELKINKSI